MFVVTPTSVANKNSRAGTVAARLSSSKGMAIMQEQPPNFTRLSVVNLAHGTAGKVDNHQ